MSPSTFRVALGLLTASCTFAFGCGVAEINYPEPTFAEGDGKTQVGSDPFRGPPSLPAAGVVNECGGMTIAAKKVPLYIVIALDRSESMSDAGKWQAAANGLGAFFEMAHADVSASVALFPQKDSSCGGDYVQPTLAMAPLPTPGFRAELSKVNLLHGTPMRPALEGAATYAATLQVQLGTTARVIVALVSDGKPSTNLCSNNDVADVVAVAARAQQLGIFTYAVGMPGALQQNLDQVALAGGTNKGTLLSAVDPGTQLTAAFETIRNQFDCEVALPPLDQGTKYAPDQVNVVYSAPGGAATTVPYSNGCIAGEGWRYDNAATPSRIMLCPQTCARGRQGSAQVQVKLGCPTEGERPR